MYWLRWHYHVKDIAGAPYKIKKKERKEKKNVSWTKILKDTGTLADYQRGVSLFSRLATH